MKRRAPRDFFTVPTVQLAKKLLGSVLVHETPHGALTGRIIETEAYTEDDPASHAFNGKRTKRNESMFMEGGHLYVYTLYGIHQCVNIVSENTGRGCAVLIRAVVPIDGIDTLRKNRGNMRDSALTDGPGKVCQAFGILPEYNGIDITNAQSPVYVVAGKGVVKSSATPRIGISKAQDRRWRFIIR